ILDVKTFSQIGDSALIGKTKRIEEKVNGLPTSFVPGRNLIFGVYAAALAFKKGFKYVGMGVCQTDFSGYPDCRDESIRCLESTIRKGFETDLYIHTPLMLLTKAETVKLMQKLGKLDWYKYTHTCYEGKRPACRVCPACKLRLKGFKDAGVKDPIEYVSGG
ncbi:hypothetical protein LCGC14_1922030, partial [marine sediment metagenome]